MRTLSRALHRHARRRAPLQQVAWVNDEQFEILESGVLDEHITREGTVRQLQRP